MLLEANAEPSIGVDEHLTFGARPYRYRVSAVFGRHERDNLIFAYPFLIFGWYLTAFWQWVLVKEDIGGDNASCAGARVLFLPHLYHTIIPTHPRFSFPHTS